MGVLLKQRRRRENKWEQISLWFVTWASGWVDNPWWINLRTDADGLPTCPSTIRPSGAVFESRLAVRIDLSVPTLQRCRYRVVLPAQRLVSPLIRQLCSLMRLFKTTWTLDLVLAAQAMYTMFANTIASTDPFALNSSGISKFCKSFIWSFSPTSWRY